MFNSSLFYYKPFYYKPFYNLLYQTIWVRSNSLRKLSFSLLWLTFATYASSAELEIAIGLEANQNDAAALVAYKALLNESEKNLGPYAVALIEPLLGLSRSHFALGQLDEAITTNERAQHLIHRNFGVYAPKQIEGIELLISAYIAQGDVGSADQQQTFKLFLSEHNVNENSVDLLPALNTIADWYLSTGQVIRAKRAIERSRDIITTASDSNDPRLLAIVQKLANIRRMSRFCCSHKIMQTATEIIAAHPELSATERSIYYLNYADALTMSNKNQPANEYYKKAWQLMTVQERDHFFSKPNTISFARVLDDGRSASSKMYHLERDHFGSNRFEEISKQEQLRLESLPPQSFELLADKRQRLNLSIRDSNTSISQQKDKVSKEIGFPYRFNLNQLKQILPFKLKKDEFLSKLTVTLDFSVDAKGNTNNIGITSADTPVKLSRLMREVVKKSHFRPRLTDGVPVNTNHVQITQRFEP